MHKLLATTMILMAMGAPLRAADEPAGQGSPAREPGPFNEPSALPYALPRFDAIKDADFVPAFEAGMAEQRAEVDAIGRNPEPPSFENTLAALERSGRVLDRVSKVFFNLDASNTDPEIQRIKAL